MNLFFTQSRLDRLTRRIKHDPGFRTRWETLRQRGEELLAIPWPGHASSGDPYAEFRAPAQHLATTLRTLAVLQSIEPDERFARKIRDGLLFYGDDYPGYAQWCSPPFRARSPSWNSELVTGNLCLSYAVGLTVLRDWLPEKERQRIVAALVNKGILPLVSDWLFPETRIHSLDSMGHNWWIVCVSLAGVGVLAVLKDRPEATGWLEMIDRALPLWFSYQGNRLDNRTPNFDADGGYYECVHYANYAVMEYLLYVTGRRDLDPQYSPAGAAHLRQVESFFLHTFYPASDGNLIVNFGDTRHNPPSTMSMRLLAENGICSEAAQWYVERTSARDAHALGILLESEVPGNLPDSVPKSAHFSGIGLAVMRSSWENDATLLAVRAGVFWIHAHADSASFVLFHRGRTLIGDPGHCDYSRPEYADYYASSRAHNVVLVNGEGAPREDFSRGSKFPGSVHSLLDDGTLRYVFADASGPMSHLLKRHYRHWIWLGGVIVIFDDLLAHQPACFQWLLHPAGKTEWNDHGVSIKHDNADAALLFLYPEKLIAESIPAPGTDSLETQTSYLQFSTLELTRQQNFLAVISLDSTIVPELIQTPDQLGTTIDEGGLQTAIFFNLLADGRLEGASNSHTVLDGWETDAYLLAITRDAQTVVRILAIGCSYLRRESVSWLDSISNVNCLVTFGENLEIRINGQPEIQFRCRSVPEPHSVQVNGSAAAFAYNLGTQTVQFRI